MVYSKSMQLMKNRHRTLMIVATIVDWIDRRPTWREPQKAKVLVPILYVCNAMQLN